MQMINEWKQQQLKLQLNIDFRTGLSFYLSEIVINFLTVFIIFLIFLLTSQFSARFILMCDTECVAIR